MKSTKWFGIMREQHWSNLRRLTDNLHLLLNAPLPSNEAWCEQLRITLESISHYNAPRD